MRRGWRDQSRIPAVRTLFGAVMTALMAGCASSPLAAPAPRVSAPASAVFAPPLPGGDQAFGGFEDSRRDAALNLRLPSAVTASAEWPEADRPSLEQYRYIPVLRQPDSRSSVFYLP